jgi:hypothetical protein
VEVVDVDGDGDLDVITSNVGLDGPNSISVIKNLGGGTLGAPASFEVGEDPTALATGDFNEDGRPDVVTPNSGSGTLVGQQSTVSVLLNTGTGSFGAAQYYNVGENARPEDVAVADFNADGNLDFAVASSTGYRVSVFRGNGLGGFTLQNHFAAESPRTLDVADFDDDGDIDIVYCNVDAAQMLVNTGTSFSTGVYMSNFPTGCMYVVAADINGDELPDFATTGRSMTVHINNGTGTSFTKTLLPTGENATGLDVADLNRDGSLDLFTSNYLANSFSVWPNNGAGGFGQRRDWGVGANPWGIGLGDLNADGFVDVVAPNSQLSQAQVTIAYNRGNETFLARRDYGLTGGAEGVEIADFDLDGRQDVVVGVELSNQDNLAVFFGKPDGTLEDAMYFENFSNNSPTDVAVGNFNGDSLPDVVASIFSPGNRIRVLLNLGNRDFAPSASYEAGGNPSGVDTGDLNGFGFDDIICTNGAQFDNTISVFYNNGNGTFADQIILPTLLRPSGLAIGDLDNDQDRDVVVTHFGDNRILIFRNDGFGNLDPTQTISIGGPQTDVILRDLNGDGWRDIAVAAGTIVLVPNSGGNFAATQATPIPGDRLDAADFDVDGDLDLVGTAFVHSLAHVGRNNGAGTFALDNAMFAGYETDQVAARDIDQDGLPEFVSANSRARSISFFRNTTEVGATVAPTSYTLQPGVLVSGNLASLASPDNNRMVMRPGVVLISSQPPIALTVQGTAPSSSADAMRIVVESSASSASIAQWVDAFNFQTGQFDSMAIDPLTTNDVRRTYAVTNPTAHIGPGNIVRCRVRFKAEGPVLIYPWNARVDELTWRIAQ